jgi:nucleoid-associated protein YgaU
MTEKHQVQPGDTLWDLANQEYDDYGAARTLTAVQLIAAANLVTDPDFITVGQVVYFPSVWP